MEYAKLIVKKHSADGDLHKVRTSPRQFQIMISFMEKHGDLNKYSTDDRSCKYPLWSELATSLNEAADVGAQARPIDRWKKVWSDLKNNTKRKAMKLLSSPNTQQRLAPAELRLLTLMDMIKTINVTEAHKTPPALSGAGSAQPPAPPPALALLDEPSVELNASASSNDSITFEDDFEKKSLNPLDGAEPGAGLHGPSKLDDEFSWPKSHSPRPVLFDNCISLEECTVTADCAVADCTTGTDCAVTEVRTACEHRVCPDRSGHTSVRCVRGGGRAVQRLAAALLRGEARRRAESRARLRLDAALRRDRLRLRAAELKVHTKWQAVCDRGLDLMERFLDQQSPLRTHPAEDIP